MDGNGIVATDRKNRSQRKGLLGGLPCCFKLLHRALLVCRFIANQLVAATIELEEEIDRREDDSGNRTLVAIVAIISGCSKVSAKFAMSYCTVE
jgi:hypothetical protein